MKLFRHCAVHNRVLLVIDRYLFEHFILLFFAEFLRRLNENFLNLGKQRIGYNTMNKVIDQRSQMLKFTFVFKPIELNQDFLNQNYNLLSDRLWLILYIDRMRQSLKLIPVVKCEIIICIFNNHLIVNFLNKDLKWDGFADEPIQFNLSLVINNSFILQLVLGYIYKALQWSLIDFAIPLKIVLLYELLQGINKNTEFVLRLHQIIKYFLVNYWEERFIGLHKLLEFSQLANCLQW
jgi:hypothetical protein